MQSHSEGTKGGRDGARRPKLCGQELPQAGHICAFFDSSAEKFDVLASYLGDAIGMGDRVIDVVESASRDEHVRGLRAAGIDVDTAVERGQMRLASCEDMYFRDGRLDLDAVLDMLRDALHTAREDGAHVRTCGEMNWVGRDPSTRRRALEYEARVNELIPGFDCTMLCVYDLAHTPAALLTDILATHPYAVIGGQLRANPWAVNPVAYLGMLRSRPPSPTELRQLRRFDA